MKRIGFALLACCIPVLMLGFAEGALRWAGVGSGAQEPFVPVPGHADYEMLNPAFFGRYFNDTFVPEVAYEPFLRDKPTDVFRVVVLGGSSVAGFPYRFYLGFPAWLRHRLETSGQRVEVINVGITAANSFTFWDLREEVAARRPDVVLIYAGHNEYYGALGAGSSINVPGNALWLKRLVLRLKRLVLYRTLERGLRKLLPEGRGDGRTLMARMIREAGIAYESEPYRAGIEQFERNMREVLATFRAAGIPVFMGTLVSNLKDQSPLGEDPEALAAYEEAQTLLDQGDTTAAYRAFLRAKELDPVRFRAPEAINTVIRRFADEGLVTLVDLEAVVQAHTPEGIGDEWFFADHLHPNLVGYRAVAEAFFEALRRASLIPEPVVRPVRDEEVMPADLRQDDRWREAYIWLDRQLADPFERLYAHLQVFSLRAGYPFTRGDPDLERIKLEQMLARVRHSRSYLDVLTYQTLVRERTADEAITLALPAARARGDTLYALQLYRSALAWQPFDPALHREAAGYARAVAQRQRRYVPLAEQILWRTVHLGHNPGGLTVLAALRRQYGDEAAARVLTDLARQQEKVTNASGGPPVRPVPANLRD